MSVERRATIGFEWFINLTWVLACGQDDGAENNACVTTVKDSLGKCSGADTVTMSTVTVL